MTRRTAPMHVRRPTDRRKKKPAAPVVAAPVYPDGFFLELVVAHDWPPKFEARLPGLLQINRQKTEAGERGREIARSMGIGWGNGTIVLPNTPHRLAPGFMGRRA